MLTRKTSLLTLFTAGVGAVMFWVWENCTVSSSIAGFFLQMLHVALFYLAIPIVFSGLLYVLVGCVMDFRALPSALDALSAALLILAVASACALVCVTQYGAIIILSGIALGFRLLRRLR